MTDASEFASTAGTLTGRIYAVLKDRLLHGVYQPGQRLPIETLAQEFGVSKQPVREAFRALSADGLLDIKPQIGSIVAAYSPKEFALFYRVLAGYERAAAEAAAVNATDEQISRLRAFLHAAESRQLHANPTDQLPEFRRSNREFHAMVHAMANSRLLTIQGQRLWDLSDFLLSSLQGQDGVRALAPKQHTEHWDIVEAFESRDSERAGLIMLDHVNRIAEMTAHRV